MKKVVLFSGMCLALALPGLSASASMLPAQGTLPCLPIYAPHEEPVYASVYGEVINRDTGQISQFDGNFQFEPMQRFRAFKAWDNGAEIVLSWDQIWDSSIQYTLLIKYYEKEGDRIVAKELGRVDIDRRNIAIIDKGNFEPGVEYFFEVITILDETVGKAVETDLGLLVIPEKKGTVLIARSEPFRFENTDQGLWLSDVDGDARGIIAQIRKEFGVHVNPVLGSMVRAEDFKIILNTLRAVLFPREKFQGMIKDIYIYPAVYLPEGVILGWVDTNYNDRLHLCSLEYQGQKKSLVELARTLVHEVAHLFELFPGAGYTSTDWLDFQKLHGASSKEGLKDFFTYYARANWHEDFAETVTAYLMDSISAVAKARSSNILSNKLRIAIKAFQFREEGVDYVYVFKHVGKGIFERYKAPLAAEDGLPVLEKREKAGL